MLKTPDRFMRMRDVKAATGLGASTIYRLIAQGRFPRQVKLLGNRTSAWPASEIEAWQHERIEARDAKDGKAA